MAEQTPIPFEFPTGRSFNYITYGPQPTDLPSLVTGVPSYTTEQQYIEQRNEAVLVQLQGYNLQLGRQQYDISQIGKRFNVPESTIEKARQQAALIKSQAGTKTDSFVETVQRIGLGIIVAVDAVLLAMFASPTVGVLADAPASGTTGAVGPTTIDTTYFGFEEGTLQSMGVSPYAGGPVTLSPEVSAGFAGAPAASLSLSPTTVGVLGAVENFLHKVSDFFTKNVLGSIENAISTAVTGGSSVPTSQGSGGPGATQLVPYGGGGGGLSYNPNTNVGQTGNGAVIFFGVLVGVLLLVMYFKKK